MRIYNLSKKEINQFLHNVLKWLPKEIELSTKNIRIAEIDDGNSIIIENNYYFVRKDNEIVPFINMNKILQYFGKITIDKGAIRFICDGANVMRPGIIRFIGDFNSGDIVSVIEEEHEKTLSVGIALCNSSEAKSLNKGIIVKNTHYVGDIFWEAFKTIKDPFDE